MTQKLGHARGKLYAKPSIGIYGGIQNGQHGLFKIIIPSHTWSLIKPALRVDCSSKKVTALNLSLIPIVL